MHRHLLELALEGRARLHAIQICRIPGGWYAVTVDGTPHCLVRELGDGWYFAGKDESDPQGPYPTAENAAYAGLGVHFVVAESLV